jgi:hypothetical protein
VRRFLFTVVSLILFGSVLSAQTWRVGWIMDSDVYGTAANAQTLEYRIYVNNATTGTVLTGVACTGTTTINCTAPLPPPLIGVATIAGAVSTLTAKVGAVETVKSNPFSINPTAPTGFFISKQ